MPIDKITYFFEEDKFRLIYLIIGLVILSLLITLILNYLKDKEREKKLKYTKLREIDNMTGIEFEKYLKNLFEQNGYIVELTKASQDYGADLILKGKKKIVVQAKRYKADRKVGIAAVQQIIAAKDYYKAQEAWVFTNSFYTKSAVNQALVSNIKLYDRNNLIDFLEKFKKLKI
ncbi:MAG: restriction endonuclease [Helcococcus sp.]|nr:restriction endonuclease [Helcococcus sp.]